VTKLREIRLTDRISARIASRTALAGDDEGRHDEAGMATVEYAVGIIGAGCAAGILIKFLKSDAFFQIIKNVVNKAVDAFV